MRTVARTFVAAALAVGLAACGDPAALATGSEDEGTVTVSGGVTPDYTWTGGAARRLSVSDLSTGEIVWDIQALDANVGFRSPVAHGVTPETARQSVVPRILEAGIRYDVTVRLLDGSDIAAEFVP